MAQKINPISFRLGVTQLWNLNFQVYGQTFKFYTSILHKYLKIYKFLNRLFYLSNFSLNYQEWKISRSKIKISIFYSVLLFNNKTQNFRYLLKIIRFWFIENVCIYPYLKVSWSLSDSLLIAYIRYLLKKNVTLKKVVWNLNKFLKLYLNSKKLCYFRHGILRLHLKGFKIKISGRFDNSKNQLAKSFEQSAGHLPLTCLKSYVIFFNEKIYTKSGTCGLKVWLYYEFCK